MSDRARVVVIGGGIHGAALLYHLAKEGWTDCVLLEKAELTSGSTWHAAGQITNSVGDYTTAAFHQYAIETYETIEEETGQAVSFHQPGGLRVAYDLHELDALKAQLGIGAYLGYDIELVSPERVLELNPNYNIDGVLAAIWTPNEGHVDPTGATMAFIAGAKAMGASVVRHNRVTDIKRAPDDEWEIVTEKGSYFCEHVVDAAGCYADQVAQMVGLRVPQANVLHHYLVTDPVPEFDGQPEMPVMRDNKVAGYIRQEQEAALIGIYEKENAITVPEWADGVPWEAENPLFDADYDLLAPWLEETFNRMPILAELGIRRVVRGAITHTTDANMLLGPAPGLRNYWLNTGSSIGLAWGPGAGRELARWMVHGEVEYNIRHYDPRRFGWMDMDYAEAKSIEDYEWMFRPHVPDEERYAYRPVRTSPFYERMIEHRAIHTQAFGWEQPKWFVPESMPLEDAFGHRRVEWFDAVAEEHKAVRERVGLMDLTAFAKYEISGPDAESFLNRMITNNIPKTIGRMSLGYVLSPTGRIETEVTTTKLADGHYYMVSGPMGEQRDFDWFDQHRTADEGVTVSNVTTDRATLVIAGPHARDLLSKCTDDDVSNDGFKWLTGRTITVCDVELLALRVGFSGALGWELHGPIDQMLAVYDGLWEAGQEFGVADFGSHALNSLRMEKAYLTRFELTHDIGPKQAGVDFFVKDTKEYIGSDQVDRVPSGNDWRLVYLDVDNAGMADGVADCHGGEGVFAGDQAVGLTTSGGYGFTVGKSLAFAYVGPEHAAPGTELSVLILNQSVKATVLDGPVYDPENNDLRA